MSLVPTYTLALYGGDDRDFIVRWKDSNSDPIDLTGFTALMELKPPGGLCEDPVLSLVGAIADPPSGEIIFTFTAADTDALIVSCATTCYSYDVQLTSPGSLITTILQGIVSIEKGVTE